MVSIYRYRIGTGSIRGRIQDHGSVAPDDGQGGPLVPLLLFVTLHVVMAPTADGDSEFCEFC